MTKGDIEGLRVELGSAVGKRAARLRRLIEAEEGSSGDYEYTGIPCPYCDAEDRLTNGGYTPRLVKRVDDGSGDMTCFGIHGKLNDIDDPMA